MRRGRLPRHVVLLLLAAAAVGSARYAAAQPVPTPEAVAASLARTAESDNAAYAFVEALTTEVGQRLAGTEAQARAVDWAKAKLAALGLENVHTEEFPLTAWLRGAETVQVLEPSSQRLIVAALGGSVATPPDGIDAEIVLFHTYADLLAAPPGSLDGKIAVVTQRMVRAQDGGGYGAANPIRRAGPSEAAKRGAVAYLHRSLGTDTHRLPHAGALNYVDGVKRIPAAALSNPDADQLERLAARGPVKLRLVLTPTEQENARSWNVVGEVKGRQNPDEIVLIGAHLDSWDLGTGAIDDGAGDAIVSEVGHLLAGLPQHPKRTVRVVLFGAEEMDWSGPAYAKAHAAEAARIAIAAECDFGARRVISVQLPPGIADGNFGHRLDSELEPFSAFVDRRPSLYGGDDIRELHAAGVPVASLRQDGNDYFDIHHTADDTLDKIDPKELAQAAAVWASFVYLAAETDTDFRATR